MFSKLVQNVRTFLSRPSLVVEDSHSLAADRQIQADLAIAADDSMVAIRLQDHTLPGTGVVKDGEAATPKRATRTRKDEDGSSNTPKQSSSKRKRTHPEPSTQSGDTPTRPSSTLDPTRITAPMTTLDADVTLGNNTKPSQHHGGPSVADMVEARTDPIDGSTSESEAIASHDTSIIVEDSKETSSADTLVNEQDSDKPNQSITPVPKKRKAGRKRKDDTRLQKSPKLSAQAAPESDVSYVGNGTVTKMPIHKRFGSEEPILEISEKLPPSQASGVNADTNADHFTTIEDDSGDDAPETMSAAAGLSQSRKAAADAAKAVER